MKYQLIEIGFEPGFLTCEKSRSVGGVGGWGRNLTPHTPHTPHTPLPTVS
ncbi:hypothetical protein GJB62_03665 [Nostoc sp. ATCC 53789]|nr:hypothetical protein GJB62_03665 [Nostoc sp. ATCC 53789]